MEDSSKRSQQPSGGPTDSERYSAIAAELHPLKIVGAQLERYIASLSTLPRVRV